MTRISIISGVGLLLLLLPLHGGIAEDKKEKGTAKADTVAKAAEMDTVWMSAWERVSELTSKQRAFEIEKATPSVQTGVRGEDIEGRLYLKEGSRAPSCQEVRKAIDQLKENVAEALYFIGQCYARIGEEKEALAAYSRLLKERPNSKWAKKAKGEMERLEKKTPEK